MVKYNKKKPTSPRGRSAKEIYPHFRKYKFEEGGEKKKGKHPKLIVEKEGSKYGFMGLTESPKRGHHNNFPLSKNPQKGRKDPAYIRNELRYDSTENFSEVLLNYKLSREDKVRILEYVRKLKEKKKK